MTKGRTNIAKKIALVGIMTATLECAKLVLAPIPNVEAVTLLTALYGYAFGYLGILASLLFVTLEPLIWGFGLWVISYFLYWPLLALLFLFIGRMNIKNRYTLTAVATVSALISTVWFGVLTSLVDIGLFTGYYDDFFTRFGIYYLRGLSFYITQLVTNAVLFPLLFVVLSKRLLYLKKKMIS